MTLPPFLTNGPAACAQPGIDPELWHNLTESILRTARRICHTCPLMLDCQQHALADPALLGTWGGLTSKQRRQILDPNDGTWLDEEGRVRRPCGSNSAFRAHLVYGETCRVCEEAQAARVREERRAALVVEHAKGGSPFGAQLHHRLGEEPCGACRGAVARQSAERRAARQAPVQPRRQVLAA